MANLEYRRACHPERMTGPFYFGLLFFMLFGGTTVMRNKIAPFFLVLGIFPALLFTSGCVTESRWPKASSEEKQASIFGGEGSVSFIKFPPRYSLDPPMGEDTIAPPAGEEEKKYPIPDEASLGTYDPFKRYAAQTYYGDDGSVTRHYYLDNGSGTNIANLLTTQIEGLSIKGGDVKAALAGQQVGEVVVWPNFLVDSRPVMKTAPTPFSGYRHSATRASDLMVVKATPEKLKEADTYLGCLQNEIPMIEIQVRVAELAVSDSLQYGLTSVIDKITGGDAFLKGWLNRFNTESFNVAGESDFPGALISIGGDHDKLNLNAQLELLQRISDSEILAAPRITVLNGHRAVISTGNQTPVVSPIISGNQTAFSYSFKPTGVTLSIVPHLLPGGIIQIQVTAEVSAVVGEETIDLGDGPVHLPIVSKRNLGTKLRVGDGKEFVLGGLYTYSDFEIISKVPVLGDVPILGYLFKTQSKAKAKSEILFHIVPRVVRGPGGLIDREQEGGP